MEEIVSAITSGDAKAVRRIISEDPRSAWEKTKSGDTPVQIACALGRPAICAALLKNTPQCIEDISITPRELLKELIFDFSESTLGSSWNAGIEFDLWSLITEDDEYHPSYRSLLAIDRDYLDEIGWIASWAEGWFLWSDEDSSPRFVGMESWERTYNLNKRANK